MDGYKIIAISGIDGIFLDFSNLIEPRMPYRDCLKLSYNRSHTFLHNIDEMRKIIDTVEQKCCLIGWSIGAVAAAFLADCKNVKTVIMVNPFFKRSNILRLRNIICDEEVCLSSTITQSVHYVIISGICDDKIPYTESLKVAKWYNINCDNVHLFKNAKHDLRSFPINKIVEIITNNII